MDSSEHSQLESVYDQYDNSQGWKSRYSAFNKDVMVNTQQIDQQILSLLKKNGKAEKIHEQKVLEIGAGSGSNLLRMILRGVHPSNIYCNELLDSRMEIAKCNLPSNVHFLPGDANNISPDYHNFFDIILISTVFSSILNISTRQQLASKILELLAPDGIVIWYDFTYDNPNNPNVKGIPFSEVLQLFGNRNFTKKRMTLAPPIARRLARLGVGALKIFNFPFLRTHIIVSIK